MEQELSLPPEKVADLRVKHLEMLQALITRMATYGASFKSYCITVTTAVIGFAFTLHKPGVAALALLPVIAFAIADANYLRVERKFRQVFEIVRAQGWHAMPTFEMSPSSIPDQTFASALTSWSIVWFYLPLAIGVVLAVVGAFIYG